MTPMERFNAAKIALFAMLAWLIGWPLVLIILAMATAKAEMYCFESDAAVPAARNAWTHHSVVLWGSTPRVSPGGTVMISLRGYGYDDAPKPQGGTDLVPLTGAAVKDVDGSWLISISGTLLQYSTIGYVEGASIDAPMYYTISLWWALSSVDLHGYGHVGNVAAGFQPHIPGAVDDSYASIVWPVDCGSLR